jgi:glucose/arabinose dehydrogenase
LFFALAGIILTADPVFSQYRLVNAFPSLTFDEPLLFTHAGDGSNRVYVVEQGGVIKVFENDSTVTLSNTFLDVSAKISEVDEQGLLGLAFHPNYSSNRFFYIYYTKAVTGELILARYTRNLSNPLIADTSSELIIFTIAHPNYANHNGGCLMFGLDGYLYIGIGDGGSGGDPFNNAQNKNVLLGKILRIDINNPSGGNNYGIPPDNPFAGGGGRPEIYCYGMRNPWRFCQDPVTGIIYCGDVGQNIYEEVDIIINGGNYGWRIMEGYHCYNPPTGCDSTGLIIPIKEYSHNGSGCAITGGYVYRGSRMQSLVGCYVYGDYCSTNIWSLKYENGFVTQDELLAGAPLPYLSLSSFGVDQNNELFVCRIVPPGAIYRIEQPPINLHGGGAAIDGYELEQNYPNPFNPGTNIKYKIIKNDLVTLRIYDASGREVSTLVDQKQSPGIYNVQWDGRTYSSGIYFYTISAGDFKYSRKMVLVK